MEQLSVPKKASEYRPTGRRAIAVLQLRLSEEILETEQV